MTSAEAIAEGRRGESAAQGKRMALALRTRQEQGHCKSRVIGLGITRMFLECSGRSGGMDKLGITAI